MRQVDNVGGVEACGFEPIPIHQVRCVQLHGCKDVGHIPDVSLDTREERRIKLCGLEGDVREMRSKVRNMLARAGRDFEDLGIFVRSVVRSVSLLVYVCDMYVM